MGIEGLALMFGPLGLGLPAAKAEELATEIAGSPLTLVSPVLGFALPVLNAIIDSGPLSNPLFRAANDNAIPTNAQEAVDGIIENLDAAQTLIDEEKWNEAGAVLDGVRKTYFADLPKAQRDTFWKESPRYALLMAESRRMQALVFQKQGKFEQAQSIVEAALGFLREEYMDELAGDERAEALLVRGKLKDLGGDTEGAKKDFESAAAINPDYQAQVDAYQKALDAFEEEGEKRMIDLAKQAAKDGWLPADKCPPELSAYVSRTGDELEFTEAYKTLSESEKVVVFQNLLKVARLEKMRKGAETETDPLKKLFLEGQVALTDGNLALAQVKMAAFKAESKDSKDESILAMRKQVRLELRTLALGAITRLEGYNEALVQQRRNNPEMLLSGTESTYRHNKNYLAGLKGIIEEGRFDTIDEAIGAYKNLGAKQDKAYRDTNVIGSIVSTSSLNWKQPSMGSDEFWAMKKSDNEVSAAYHQLEWDSKLFEADAFPDTAYIRLEGGTYKAPPPSLYGAYPNVIRVVVGKEGGELFTMDRKRVSFPASDRETVVLLKGGNLEAAYPQLKQNKDYFMEPTPFIEIGFVDDDFDALLKMESLEGLSKMQDPSERREYLLGVVQDIRERNGSYVVAGTILEELLAKDMETAVDAIPETDRKAAVVEVNGELDDTKSEVQKQLDRMKEEEPTAWAARFPDGNPSQEEVDAMVDMAQKEKLSCKLKRMAFERISESYDDGTLTDPISRKAWDVYNDMKDPLDEFWNISDDTGDRIVDEVVITVVTLPLTMGAGKLAHAGLEGCVWMSRLARMGRLGAFSARALTMTGVAATEGFVQQAANPVTVLQILHDLNDPSAPSAFRMDQQLKDFGWGVMVSFAFHGGAGLWKRGAQALKIEKNAVANLGGTFTTQTLLSSGIGEFEAVLFDRDAPGTFFERIGGHAARMVGRHYGTQTFHLATGGQFRQTEPKTNKVETADDGPIPDLALARQATKVKAAPSGPDDVTKIEPKGKLKTEPLNDPVQRQQPLKTVGHPDEGTAGPNDKTRVIGNGTAAHRTRVLETSVMSALSFTEANVNGLKDPNQKMSFRPIRNEQGRIAGVRILVTEGGVDGVVTALKAKGILEASFKMAEGQDVIDIPNPDGAPISLRFTPIENTPVPVRTTTNTSSSNKSPLLPADAAFAGIGPAAGFIADFFGVSPTVATLLGAAGMFLPVLGMVFNRSRMFSEPQRLNPPLAPNQTVSLGYKGEASLCSDAAGRWGIRQNGSERVLVNGKPVDAKWSWVKVGDTIEAGGKTYIIQGRYPGAPTSVDDLNRQAKRPYALDQSFRQMNGPDIAGSYKTSSAEAEGRFVTVTTDAGKTVSVAVEGNGRAPGQSNAAVEVEALLPDAIDGGTPLTKAFTDARTHVEASFRKDDGTLRAGAPKLQLTGFELTPDANSAGKVDAQFVRSGGVEAIVVRLGGGNTPVFQAPEGVSTAKLQAGNDIIVTGRFAEGLSPDTVAYIVKNTKPATAEGIRDNLQQESLIRAEILREKPQGGLLTREDYRAAYKKVVGREAPMDYRGFHQGGVLKPDGTVLDAQNRLTGDRFSPTAGGFMVQIVK